jgi:hypothetical protein
MIQSTLILIAAVFMTTSAANAGAETEIKLRTPLVAAVSEDQCERLIVAARSNDQYMIDLMVQNKQAVVIPKGKTVIVENAEAEITKDDTGVESLDSISREAATLYGRPIICSVRHSGRVINRRPNRPGSKSRTPAKYIASLRDMME